MTRRQALSYFASMASVLGALVFFAVLLGFFADPYRMWDTPAVSGWTAMKPRIYERAALAKTYLLERQNPRTLLLGNSRVEIGLDPESRAWPDMAKPVFNAALAGRENAMMLRLLQDALAIRAPDTVVLGLDFPDFLGGANGPRAGRPGEDDARFLVGADGKPNPQRAWQLWKDRFAVTLSIDSVTDGLLTLADQHAGASTTMTRAGFNPLYEYQGFVAQSGHQDIFAQKQAAYAVQYSGFALPDFSDPYRNVEFRYLAGIVRLTTARNLRLVIFTHPYHREYLDMLWDKGFWPAFEEWKRAVIRVVDKESGEKRDLVRFWDFSGYNAISMEPVPPPGDTHTQMHWYWESGHYKNALGDLLISRMTGGRSEPGQEVTKDNLEELLAQIRNDRNRLTGKLIPARENVTVP